MLIQYVLLHRTGACKAGRSGRGNEQDKSRRALVLVEAGAQFIYRVHVSQSYTWHIGYYVVGYALAQEQSQRYYDHYHKAHYKGGYACLELLYQPDRHRRRYWYWQCLCLCLCHSLVVHLRLHWSMNSTHTAQSSG